MPPPMAPSFQLNDPCHAIIVAQTTSISIRHMARRRNAACIVMQLPTGRRNFLCKAVAKLGLGAQGLEHKAARLMHNICTSLMVRRAGKPQTGSLFLDLREGTLESCNLAITEYFQRHRFRLERLNNNLLLTIIAWVSCDCPGHTYKLPLYPITDSPTFIGNAPQSQEVGELPLCDRCCNASLADPMGCQRGRPARDWDRHQHEKIADRPRTLGPLAKSLTPSEVRPQMTIHMPCSY